MASGIILPVDDTEIMSPETMHLMRLFPFISKRVQFSLHNKKFLLPYVIIASLLYIAVDVVVEALKIR